MKTEKIELRVTPEEKEIIKKLAKAQNMTTSKFIKHTIYTWIYKKYPFQKAKSIADRFLF